LEDDVIFSIALERKHSNREKNTPGEKALTPQ
jgi:hypothetical protein